MINKPQLHWSHISSYLLCGYLYYFVYILGKRRPGNSAKYTGLAVHVASGADLKAKMTDGELLPGEEVADLARDEVNRLWGSEEILLGEKEKDKGEKIVRGHTVDAAVALSSIHHSAVAPRVVPVEVEEPWVLVCDGFPYDLAGRRDVTEANGTIRDLKTIGQKPGAMRLKDLYQLTAYALWDVATKKPLPRVAADYLVNTKKPEPVTHEAQLEWQHIEVVRNYIEVVQEGLEKEYFPPALDHWIHSPGWCGLWDQCKYGGKKRT